MGILHKKIVGLASGLALVGFSGASYAGPITTDSWVGFCFGNSGSAASAGCQNEAAQSSGNDFTFSLASISELKVTDAFLYGDTFKVYDFGSLLFTTNTVPTFGSGASNPDAAWADASFSHGSYVLGTGNHSISVFADTSPHGSGGAYLGVFTSAVPEPETYAMLLAGLGMMGAVARRRQQKKNAA